MGQIMHKIKEIVERLDGKNSNTKSSLSTTLQKRTIELDEGLGTSERKVLSQVLSKLELIEKVVENQSKILGEQEVKLKVLETTVQHAHDALQTLPLDAQDKGSGSTESTCKPGEENSPLTKMLDKMFPESEETSLELFDSKGTEAQMTLDKHTKTLNDHEHRLDKMIEKIQSLWDSLNKGPVSLMPSMQKELSRVKGLLESLRQKQDSLKKESLDEFQLQQKLLDNLFSGFVVAFLLLVFICMFHK